MPDVLPYTVSTSNFINKTLSVRTDIFKPRPKYFQESLATATIILINAIPQGTPITVYSDYPAPNTVVLQNFTFSSITASDQASELSNYIKNETDYSSKNSGTNVKVIAPVGSGSLINNKEFVVVGAPNDISITPFSGGDSVSNDEIDIVFSERQIMTTSSDGSMVIQLGAGSAIQGSYLNVNLKDPGLKINIYVDPSGESNYEILESGQDVLPILSNVNNDTNSINQLFSNSFSLPSGDGDFRDIITLPKKTRWYSNLLNSRGNTSKSSTPYSSQDLNNQKKI